MEVISVNETSQTCRELSPNQPYKYCKELSSFETNLDIAIAAGMFDQSITVQDRHGAYPIVAALADEQLYYLNERIRACGGYANVFVLDHDKISVIHSVKTDGVPSEADDFTELRTGESSVGMFMAYLKSHPEGVCIPARLEMGVETRMSIGNQTVERDRMPELQI